MTTTFMQERRKDKMPRANLLKKLKSLAWDESQKNLIPGLGREVESVPLTVGVLFSGGPAPGGHNVICGLYMGLKELNDKSNLIGFIGGCQGLIDGKHKEITQDRVDHYRNTGGFDMLGSGRKKVETEEHFKAVAKVVSDKKLNAIVFVGGDDTNTNAAHLANYFNRNDIKCCIIGIPKTIDGDLKTDKIETSFGFDTACKVYCEMIGNICYDAMSSLKYWHFIKVMGRKASHVALECALQTQPNLTFISEEVEAKKQSLQEIVKQVADTVVDRANSGKSYGVCLVPEGLVEFIPEFKELIAQLNRIVAKGKSSEELPEDQKKVFNNLPSDIKSQLMQDRDSHGNVQVSKIETEKMLYQMVAKELENRGFKGKFNAQPHFFGYEGRCSTPSFFDAAYCLNLGLVASSLINHRKSGVMAALSGLHREVENWEPLGVDINEMMVEEERHGDIKRVIDKSTVKLNGSVFRSFQLNREDWRLQDKYENPGPIQYCGESKGVVTKTLGIEAASKL